MSYKLSDEVLAAVAQSLQLALLTGTDIVDHLRLIEVERKPSVDVDDLDEGPVELTLTPACRDRMKRNVEDLEKRAVQLRASMNQAS